MKRVNVVMTYGDVVSIKFASDFSMVSRLVSAIEREIGVCRDFQLTVLRSDEVDPE